MDYKQHKGNLRGQIKNQAERKLYNKRIRVEVINVDINEEQLTITNIRSVCDCCNTELNEFSDGRKYCSSCLKVYK